jgi:hypothetical protein
MPKVWVKVDMAPIRRHSARSCINVTPFPQASLQRGEVFLKGLIRFP